MARILREDAERWLAPVPPDQAFWSCDNRTFASMSELADGLASMDEETFAYHVNDAKNDFSNWARDVIGDQKLSRDLAKSQTTGQAVKKVAERLNLLSSKLA
ncbi:MAG: hypothetical protein ACOC58_01510 [Chloroflexota bacterium]